MPGCALCDDGSDSPQAVTRDYTLELSGESDGAPLLSVFGGKLTTYRKLAQAACNSSSPGSARWERTGPPPAGCPVASSTARCVNWRVPALEFGWLDDRSAPAHRRILWRSCPPLAGRRSAASTLVPGCTNLKCVTLSREWACSGRHSVAPQQAGAAPV